MSIPGVLESPNNLISLITAANNAECLLTASMDSDDVEATVDDTSLFPNASIIVIDGEIIPYTSKNPTQFLGLVRGSEGTVAASHLIGASVELLITARHHNVLAEAIIAIETEVNKIKTYTHTQSSANTIWTITHNLNRFPSVTVVDSAGTTVIGNVEYLSVNQIRLTFSAAFSGIAYLN